VPYITSISALMVVMYKAKTDKHKFSTNLIAVFVAIIYSTYALYASGMEAVMGGMIVMMIGYLLYGFIAKRFVGQEAPGAGMGGAVAQE
jgi:putrescine:ornithine antiporter